MHLYLRKLFSQDISHQISVTNEIVKGFFGAKQDRDSALMIGKTSKQEGTVSFLFSTDPRFGGDIKRIAAAEGGIEVDDILSFEKKKDSFLIEVIKKNDSRYNAFISLMNKDRHLVVDTDDLDDSNDNAENVTNIDYSAFVEGGENKIFYGTPGCGKSYHVANEVLSGVSEKNVFRTTFYADYTHSDFVGQIMPSVKRLTNDSDETEDIVTYSFIPGPFTLALVQAYKNPTANVYLVIEELNRGNAASIFGDLFQLLDREKPNNKRNMPVGQSEYPIDKVDVVTYLLTEEKIVLPNGKLFIPSNLTILATMNTSDQNVYTLDTAFKRRWKMVKMRNSFKDDHPYANKYIPGTSVSWKFFVEKINNKIVSPSVSGSNNEDKQVGPFFIESYDLSDSENDSSKEKMELFAYKMLEYLWSNVSRFEHDNWFKDSPKTLDDLVDNFTNKKLDIFVGDIFSETAEQDVRDDSSDGEE